MMAPACGLALGAALLASPVARAQSFQTIYTFTGTPDGSFPLGVVFDTAGNLYGVTRDGGNKAGCPANSAANKSDGISRVGCGTVFGLTPGTSWSEAVLHTFTDGADGGYPGANLVFRAGALFGTTEYGGHANSTTCQGGCGTVFKFNPATKALTTLHAFSGGTDSGGPYAGVVFDSAGSLYGTVQGGDGANPGDDLVYKLTPPAKGKGWTYTTIFQLPPFVAGSQVDSLVVDKAGNLYGTVKDYGNGVIYELTRPAYSAALIYTFTGGADGAGPDTITPSYLPDGTLILYGVTRKGGGAANAGTVFALAPATGVLTTLYTFAGGADGAGFGGVLYRNSALYGATLAGGTSGHGTVFKLAPAKGQTPWKETVLHDFTGGADGGYPSGGAFDAAGTLYGVTAVGGNLVNCPVANGFPAGCGTVFTIKP
jgi:uncharacterized repeat protein (TIGR03803 family)